MQRIIGALLELFAWVVLDDDPRYGRARKLGWTVVGGIAAIAGFVFLVISFVG